MRKIVKKINCDVTGSRSSRKEKIEEEKEEKVELEENKVRTLKITGLLLVRPWGSQDIWEILGSQGILE